MENIKSFQEFVSEMEKPKVEAKETDTEETPDVGESEHEEDDDDSVEESLSMYELAIDESTGEVSLKVNEAFMEGLNSFMRSIVEILSKEHKLASNKIDKVLDKNLSSLVSDFKAKKSPAAVAASLA